MSQLWLFRLVNLTQLQLQYFFFLLSISAANISNISTGKALCVKSRQIQLTVCGKKQRILLYKRISVAFTIKKVGKSHGKQRDFGKRLYSVAFSSKKATEIEEFLKIRCFYCKEWHGNP